MGTATKSRWDQIGAKYILALTFIFSFAMTIFGQDKEGIKQVDFKNYSYWLNDKNNVRFTGHVKVKNGLYEEPHENVANYLYFRIDDVVYGDLTGDGIEEAVVVAAYGATWATFFQTNTYVYTLSRGRPKLLGIITEKRLNRDYYRLCVNCPDLIYEAILGGRKISSRVLTVEHFGGGSRPDHIYVMSLRYRWAGRNFVLAGSFRKRRSIEEDKILGFQKGK